MTPPVSPPAPGSDVPPPVPPSKLNVALLLQEWAQLSVYDRTASLLKADYIRGRYQIIMLTLVSTIAAVVAGVIGQQTLAVTLAVVSIILPIVASFLMSDLIRFTGTTAWIKYRYTAEMMRTHLYLYRMQAGIYAAGPPEAMDNLLATTLETVKDEAKPLESGITPRVQAPLEENAIKAAIADANRFTPDDDGISEITPKQYLSWRVDAQHTWYDNATSRDFARLRDSTRASQIVLLVGAVGSALAGLINLNLQIVVLVAITNAISVALTNGSNVSMFGKTYGLFMVASQQLVGLKSEWLALQNDPTYLNPQTQGNVIADFAQRVENTLSWERKEWYELALQSQSNSDRAIMTDLNRLTQRAEDEKNKGAA